MKKFLAVLLSVVLCATVVYSVCAEEIVPEEDVIVAPETEVEDAVEDLADQLANDEVAQEKAEELIEAIQTGSSSADIAALLGALEDYVNDAGYDVVNDLDGVLENFDKIIGLDRLKAIHVNDSKNPFAAHKDRHEKLGEGYIGLDAFQRIINHPALKELPFYLETPHEEISGYEKEISILKNLRK